MHTCKERVVLIFYGLLLLFDELLQGFKLWVEFLARLRECRQNKKLMLLDLGLGILGEMNLYVFLRCSMLCF